jgi:hypothetical protein
VTATSVHDLDLPEVELMDLDRDQAIALLTAVREHHWLARMPVGYIVTRHDDVLAVLRDRRFHSAVGLITQMAGIPEAPPAIHPRARG